MQQKAVEDRIEQLFQSTLDETHDSRRACVVLLNTLVKQAGKATLDDKQSKAYAHSHDRI